MLGSRRIGLDVHLPGRCWRHRIQHFQGRVCGARLGDYGHPHHRDFHTVPFYHSHGLRRGDLYVVGGGSSSSDGLLPKGEVLGR